jgi:RHS repeat-associated protein
MGCKIASIRLLIAGCFLLGTSSAWTCTASGPVLTDLPGVSAPASDPDGSYTISNISAVFCERKQNSDGSWPAWTQVSYSGSSKAFSGKTSGAYQYMTFQASAQPYLACIGGNYGSTPPSYCYSHQSAARTVAVVQASAMPASISFTTPNVSGAYTVSWSVVSGASRYLLEERKRNEDSSWGGWSSVYDDSGLAKNFTGKAEGSVWQYQVRTYYTIAGYNSSYSDARQSSNVVVPSATLPAPAAPASITTPSPASDGVYTISWGTSPGANRYLLQERAKSGGNWGSWSTVYDGASTSKNFDKSQNTRFQYQVKAYTVQGADTSNYSNPLLSGEVHIPPTVTASSACLHPGGTGGVTSDLSNLGGPSSSTNGSYTLTSVSQTLCYNNGGAWVAVSYSGSSKAFSGMPTGTYQYKKFQRATQSGDCGYPPAAACYSHTSAVKTVTVVQTPATAPAWIDSTPVWQALQDDGKYTVLWDMPADANRIRLEEREKTCDVNGANCTWSTWTEIQNSAATTSIEFSKGDGETWQYRVRAYYHLNGVSSDNTAYIESAELHVPFKSPTTPTQLQVNAMNGTKTSYDGEAVASWDDVEPYGTNFRYQLWRRQGTDTLEYEGPNNEFPVANLPNGPHTFFVKACNDDACSAASASVALEVLIPPDPPTAPMGLIPAVYPDSLGDAYYGNLSGQFQVSPSGAASYSVPIGIPAGTAGIAPKLSLEFNSQAGNGLVGMGWSLSGLSAIHRCPKTHAQNGVVRGIDYSANDQFCLDGQRLVSIDGIYGEDGTEYRTEIDGFSKIISYANAGTGPAWFRVWTKSGEILDYGVMSYTHEGGGDARIEAQGRSDGAVAVWALGRVEDTVGNYYTIEYNHTVSTGEYLPSRIDYTAHESEGQAPYHVITFAYETRPDSASGYSAGSKTTQSKRLAIINTDVGEYRLTYKTDVAYRPSRLESIQYCDLGGNLCQEPLTFTWENDDELLGWTSNQPQFESPHAFVDSNGNPLGVHMADLNNDGYVDLAKTRAGSCNGPMVPPSPGDPNWVPPVCTDPVGENVFGSATGWGSVTTLYMLPVVTGSYDGIQFADLDGDGDVDFLPCGPQGGCLNTGSDWTGASTYMQPTAFTVGAKDPGTRLVDLNGDGLPDVIRAYLSSDNDSISGAWLNEGTGWSGNKSYYEIPNHLVTYYPTDRGTPQNAQLVDLNGDSLPDIMLGGGARLNTGSGWNFTTTYQPPQPFTVFDSVHFVSDQDNGLRFAELNGDGLPDLVHSRESANRHAWFNTGTGWTGNQSQYELPITLVNEVGRDMGARFVDLNGDGRDDLLDNDGNVWMNTGTGWTAAGVYTLPIAFSTFTQVDTDTLSNELQGYPAAVEDSGARFVDIDADGFVDLLVAKNGHEKAWLNRGTIPQLTAITDGLGNTIDVHYKSQYDSEVYSTGDVTPQAPQTRHMKVPQQLVHAVDRPNGIGGILTTTYRYEGMLVHTQGLGSLGFRKVIQTDEASGVTSSTTYRQVWPYVGMPESSESRTAEGVLMSQSSFTYAMLHTHGLGHGFVNPNNVIDGTEPSEKIYVPVFPYIANKTETSHLLNNELGSTGASITTATTNVYDIDGNPTDITVNISDGEDSWQTVTDNKYESSGMAYCHISLLTEATVTRTGSDAGPASVRKTAFGYDPDSCLLTNETVEPGAGAPIELSTSYGHDAFGNVTSTSVSDGLQTRTATTVYDPSGRFPAQITNALGHSETHVYDPSFGVPVELIGPNGLKTCWEYDSFGRKTTERQLCDVPGAETQTQWAFYKVGYGSGLAHAATITTAQSGSINNMLPPTRVYFDALGRQLRKTGYVFDRTNEQLVYTDTVYDAMGRVEKVSEPYFIVGMGLPEFWTVSQYDALGRVLRVDMPLGDIDGTDTSSDTSATTYVLSSYQGLTTVATDVKGRTKTEIKNANGQTVKLIDPAGIALKYTYDTQGNLKTTQIENHSGTDVVLEYDIRGRKTHMYDPDMGHWTYQYNAFGELIEQTDAEGQVTHIDYDALGRMTTRTDLYGTTNAAESNWVYDIAPGAGIGKLAGESNSYGSKTYEYDAQGRLFKITQAAHGKTFETTSLYDSMGRLEKTVYPEVDGERFYVMRHYNSTGLLWYLTGPDGTVYWLADELDMRGQLVSARNHNATEDLRIYNPANGWLTRTETVTSQYATGVDGTGGDLIQDTRYTFDEVGNVLARKDYPVDNMESPSVSEVFAYDELDRILGADVTRHDGNLGATPAKTYQYDPLGNITHKSDVGDYRYGGQCATGAAGPHAVCEITDGSAVIGNYQYDANGNMILGGLQSLEREITYTPYNIPSRIEQGSNWTEFEYGPDRSRVWRESYNAWDGKTVSTWYVGLGGEGAPLYELESENGGGNTHVHFIYAGGYHGGHPFMMQVAKTDSQGEIQSEVQEYHHRDHLWSVIAISDQTGHIIESDDPSEQHAYHKSYDAWGERRNPDWTEGGVDQFTTAHGHLSFTGQESITNVGLIHMNGRVYDPTLGRFVSADPHVQFAKDTQSYNRYSYVHNNPLKYTDPTGYFLKKLHRVSLGFMDPTGHLWQAEQSLMRKISPWMAGNISTCLNFIPVWGWLVSAAFTAVWSLHNGVNERDILKAGAVSVAAHYIGKGVTDHTGSTIAGASASGAFSGGMNALVNDTSLSRGIVQGATRSAVTDAVMWGLGELSSPDVVQDDTASLEREWRNPDSPEPYLTQADVDAMYPMGGAKWAANIPMTNVAGGEAGVLYHQQNRTTESYPAEIASQRQETVEYLDNVSTAANVVLIVTPAAPIVTTVGTAASIGSAFLQNDIGALGPAAAGQAVQMGLRRFVSKDTSVRIGAGVEVILDQATR